jgi:hypothetical protein
MDDLVSERLAEILWCRKSVAHLVPNVVTTLICQQRQQIEPSVLA